MKAKIYRRGAFLNIPQYFGIGFFLGADSFVYIRFGSLRGNAESFSFGRWYDGRWHGHRVRIRDGLSR